MVTALRTPNLELIPFEPEAIDQLLRGDRAAAERTLGVALPPEFPADGDLTGFLTIQLERMRAAPDRRQWMARLMLDHEHRAVGHCGFHGPPDVIGRTEIGYTVFTEFRGRGYAKEAAGALARWAFGQGEREVFATVAPENAASLAVVRGLGFRQIGTQIDEVDGLELVFVLRDEEAAKPSST